MWFRRDRLEHSPGGQLTTAPWARNQPGPEEPNDDSPSTTSTYSKMSDVGEHGPLARRTPAAPRPGQLSVVALFPQLPAHWGKEIFGCPFAEMAINQKKGFF